MSDYIMIAVAVVKYVYGGRKTSPVLQYYADIIYIVKTCLFKYIENFTTKKKKKFQIKKSDIFMFLLKT